MLKDLLRRAALAGTLLALCGPVRATGAAAEEPALGQAARERFIHAYRALTPTTIEARKIAAFPTGMHFARIDVSDRIRSASFGHSTTLLIPTGITGEKGGADKATEFYVEYGRSTNTPAATFGPFSVKPGPAGNRTGRETGDRPAGAAHPRGADRAGNRE